MENITPSNQTREYDEISLREILSTLAKRSKLIIGLGIAAALAAFIFSLAMPKIYEVKMTLDVGVVPDNGKLIPIEEPGEIVKKINGDYYGRNVRDFLKIKASSYPKIKVNNFSDSFISFSVDSSETDLAKSILSKLGTEITGDYGPRILQKKEIIIENINIGKNDIERISAKILSVETEKKIIEAEVFSLNNEIISNQEAGIQLALASDRRLLETKQQAIEDLYLKISQEKAEILSMNALLTQSRPMAVIVEPYASEDPVSPKLALNAVLAAIAGLFAGIFLAFGIDTWQKSK
ncbi:MAG: Wzz/FepE/Etk N-terminal domain-containing protein [Candidatus Paceibacterota bacterium]